MNIIFFIISCLTVFGVIFPNHAYSADKLKEALIDEARPYINLRYRFENVQAGSLKDANASTLRTKLGYNSGKLYDFSVSVEFENVTYLGQDNFNNGINNKLDYNLVADPDSTEVNHAFLTWTGPFGTTLKIGRQPYNLDDQRFVGTLVWRQNDQTYDSISLTKSFPENAMATYIYIYNVNRIFGDSHPKGDLSADAHLVNISYGLSPFGKLTAYAYLLDLQEPVLSSQTFGARFFGKTGITKELSLLYAGQYAYQSDYKNNPQSYNANYYHIAGGIQLFKQLTVKAGYEVLGSNGTTAFKTPLATAHLFNGWADKFLSTPAKGLEDIYASLSYKMTTKHRFLNSIKLSAIYHDFSSQVDNRRYGDEWNGLIAWGFLNHYSLVLKYASYNAAAQAPLGSLSQDTQKIWVMLSATF